MLEKKVIRGEGIKVPVHKLNSVLQIGDYIITSGVSPKDFVTNEWAVGMHVIDIDLDGDEILERVARGL